MKTISLSEEILDPVRKDKHSLRVERDFME